MVLKCVFPCAGFGTRFLPVTKTIPKEMLPIGQTPLIEYAVHEAFLSKINNMCFITTNAKNSIRDYFLENNELSKQIRGTNKENSLSVQREINKKCTLEFINQNEALGLGHAIYQAKDFINQEPFAVILPDDMCAFSDVTVLHQMIQIHKRYPNKCILALEKVQDTEISKYGVVEGIRSKKNKKLLEISNLIEKPTKEEAPSNLAIIGRYILTSDIFNSLESVAPDQNGEIQITSALIDLAKQGKVLGLEFDGVRFDCGTFDGFYAANELFKKTFSG